MLFGTGVPDQVGTFPFDKAGVYWERDAYRGNYLKNSLKFVNDPQRDWITDKTDGGSTTFRSNCDLVAVADANDNIILQNPLPGHRGNFGFNRLYGPGSWNADMSLSKSVKID